MSLGRSLFAGLLLLLAAPACAFAQVSCVPNPNAAGPPFVNQCPIPASGLNVLANTAGMGLPQVGTNAQLQALSTATFSNVARLGFTTPGDSQIVSYHFSSSPCSLNGGAGDNGSQVQPTSGSGCWNITPQPVYDVRIWGAKCDGTTNDAAVIAAARAVTNDLSFPNGNCLIGSNNNTTQFAIGGAIAGTAASNTIDTYAPLITPFYQIATTSDTVTNTGAGSGIPALGIYHKFGGSGAGPHMGLWVDLVQDGNLSAATSGFHTGVFSNVWAKSGTNAGQYYGFAGQVVDDLNFSHPGLTGGEIDVSLHQPGALIKEGWGIGSVPLTSGNDAFQGTNYSAGLGIWAGGTCGTGSGAGGSGCAGFSVGISFGRSDSYLGVANTGSLIQTTQGVGTSNNMVVANGILAGNLNVTGSYENWGGKYVIDHNGWIHITSAFPSINLNDTNATVTTGGLTRLTAASPGFYQWQINTAAGGDFSSLKAGPVYGPDGEFIPATTTVSSLPSCVSSLKGSLMIVSDLNTATPTYLQAPTGGGSNTALVMCNGTAWQVH